MDNVRRHSRVQETELMMRYFSRTGPLTALAFAPLGLKMLSKGKIGLRGHGEAAPPLEALFAKAAEMEERS